ncbi:MULTISPECIES: hypothetical protein [Rhodopseudomonas]|nr:MULTISPECIES: hypothetical protein [Rhodopseudomonas]MDF3809990.1 hypothetical protein [Rhodopseudomonas sp. BAL398]WOK20452.1 hypothetical protein RBJ75_13420 [Rhodopseudomonas sp. BAL398]
MGRSFTRGQVQAWFRDWPDLAPRSIVVAVSPSDDKADYFGALLDRGAKLILLGSLGPELAKLAGISLSAADAEMIAAAACAPALPNAGSESLGAIRYMDKGLGAASPLRQRRLCRFDFAEEWNNLGYGRIGVGVDPWSIAMTAQPLSAITVAELDCGKPLATGAVATLRDLPSSAILWHARPVGPVDGADWQIIEAFVSHYRHADLPCRPHLRDVPHGVGAAVTMRLDCDEDIASARPLFDLYRQQGLPLSLAIKTDQPERPEHLALLEDLRRAGGSILSHSVSHAPRWGGTPEAAEAEATGSKDWLESQLPGLTVRYAVSPFHQNPSYVPDALARAGYDGFIGGIIANDPEYLMARGGEVPHGPVGFISHSQACMLHGDCMLDGGDRLRIYKEAFRIAKAGSQFFGFLDHPFSERYAYGWRSEADRLAAHAEFLSSIADECARSGETLLFVNEETCLDFMRDKADAQITFDETSRTFAVSRRQAANLPLSLGYRGSNQAA